MATHRPVPECCASGNPERLLLALQYRETEGDPLGNMQRYMGRMSTFGVAACSLDSPSPTERLMADAELLRRLRRTWRMPAR